MVLEKILRISLENIHKLLNITCSQIKTRIKHYKCEIVAWVNLDHLCGRRKNPKNLADI
jgi:hypothetical protein